MSRKSKLRGLTEDDRALWHKITRTVKPIEKRQIPEIDETSPAEPDRSKPPQRSKSKLMRSSAAPSHKDAIKSYGGQARETMAQALAEFQADQRKNRHRTPVDRGPERKVRRGKVEVEGRIDLHGLTQSQARSDLLRYLMGASERGKRTILVITGKGATKRAQDERRFQPWQPDEPALPGVIRRSLTQWMNEPDFAALVSGYAQAHTRHGGAGAFYVMLRQA